MKLTAFQLHDFRNLRQLLYEPQEKLNIFLGENGQGKTNILEAIFVLARGVSFRSVHDDDLIRYQANGFEIKGRYEKEERKFESSLMLRKDGSKLFNINSKKARHNNADRLRVVVFTPDDLYLVKGSPSLRRQFLDSGLRQLSAEYVLNHDDFIKTLRRRNFILRKGPTHSSGLDILDEILIDRASRVILARLNYVNIIQERARSIYNAIHAYPADLKIRYALSFTVDSGKINLDLLKCRLGEELKEKRVQEYRRGGTLVGPHRDDFHVYLEDKLARHFASQGQQRSLAVCLKIAEIEAFHAIKGYYPLFLLDEVLAELDQEKRLKLLEYLDRSLFQSFLTSVNLSEIEHIKGAGINLIREGTITRKE
ncbi:MAG TPA: DNA replication/repair protein RecF [Syntrophomonadaceae bacterium]|nr:DNA replication/repair protein RecF [Syntrophomonadaceae bacterium]